MIPFSIQLLNYGSSDNKVNKKGKHFDPPAYTIISALNVEGKADIILYQSGSKIYQKLICPEGSMYILHNQSVMEMQHAVSEPDPNVSSRRITLVLRWCLIDDLIPYGYTVNVNSKSQTKKKKFRKPSLEQLEKRNKFNYFANGEK